MKVYTIGFTQKSARQFFLSLQSSGIKRIVDVRLNNRSQLAGFTKRDDLAFFLKEIGQIDYVHLPELAPTQPMIDRYRKHKGGWPTFQTQFLKLMKTRRIEKSIPKEIIAHGCLLCSEDQPHHCHRRLVAEYLQEHWGQLHIHHLT